MTGWLKMLLASMRNSAEVTLGDAEVLASDRFDVTGAVHGMSPGHVAERTASRVAPNLVCRPCHGTLVNPLRVCTHLGKGTHNGKPRDVTIRSSGSRSKHRSEKSYNSCGWVSMDTRLQRSSADVGTANADILVLTAVTNCGSTASPPLQL